MTFKFDLQEAAGIVQRAMDALLLAIVAKDRSGTNARRACASMRITAESQIADNTVAEPLGECFELVRLAGASLSDMGHVRRGVLNEQPVSEMGVLLRQSCVLFCLENEALIIMNTRFTSRQEVERVQGQMQVAFSEVAERAADLVASTIYMSVVALQGAVTFFLYERARPLARMIRFQFAAPGPTLVYAYRLYDDAGRADELRAENKVIHPAFCRRSGRAMSA